MLITGGPDCANIGKDQRSNYAEIVSLKDTQQTND